MLNLDMKIKVSFKSQNPQKVFLPLRPFKIWGEKITDIATYRTNMSRDWLDEKELIFCFKGVKQNPILEPPCEAVYWFYIFRVAARWRWPTLSLCPFFTALLGDFPFICNWLNDNCKGTVMFVRKKDLTHIQSILLYPRGKLPSLISNLHLFQLDTSMFCNIYLSRFTYTF